MKITLRPYQERTEDNTKEFIENSPHKRGLIIAPTGCGKAISTATISRLTDEKCLVVQPSYELLNQNLEKARMLGLDPSVFSASAGKKDISQLTYVTPLSIVRYPELFKDFNIVVIDEAHENMSKGIKSGRIEKKSKFIEFLEYINPKKVIGLTATPIQLTQSRAGSELKMINRSRRSYWSQADIFDVTQINEICEKYWAELNYRPIPFNRAHLRLNSTGNEFTSESIIQNYKLNNNNSKILNQYEQLLSEGNKSILTFVPSVNEGHELKKLNKDFEFIFDKTPKKEREAIIKAFKKGDIPNLLNCETLLTGFDHPHLDSIILGRETNSFAVYLQIIGRVVRPIILPDGSIFKKKGTIVDLTGNYKRFGSVENITFEKQDYTKGWAMWNGDKIMTGYPFENWDMPTRNEIEKLYKSTLIKTGNPDSIIFPFGKHKGKTLSNIFKFDKGYLKWLLTNKEFEWKTVNLKQLKKEIETMFKKEILN